MVRANLCPPAIERQFHKLTRRGIRALIVSGSYAKAGVDPTKLGIDHFFIKRAQLKEKPILELEGIAFQRSLLEKNNKVIASELGNQKGDVELPTYSKLDRQVQHILCKRYARGASMLYKHLDIISPYLTEDELLVSTRNTGMAEKILSYLQTDESYFIAVGALHLVGPNSIITLLEEAGHTVTRVF